MREPDDASARRAKPPVVVYPVGTLPPADMAMLERARQSLTKISEVIVPPRDARAFEVPAGCFFRIVSIEGPQVGDLNLWNANDLSERFFSGKTRALHATHVGKGDRLWSTLPFLRPLATITEDTLGWYGFDADGAGVHDVIGTRCDPYTNRLLSGGDYHHCCHSNLSRALAAARGLDVREAELLVHDVLNVFMCTGFTRDTQQYFMKASPVRPGDYIEFFAEIDLLAALSACPGGDCGSTHSSDTAQCYPLKVEVYRPEQGSLKGWQLAQASQYPRTHGAGRSPGEMDADSVAFMAMQPPPPSSPPTADAMRDNLRRTRLINQPDPPQVARIKEYQAAGPAGPIAMRVYRGAGTAAGDELPVQVYYHGGGWVVGDLDSHDWTCRMVANAAKCAVVSIDYRLAPEHRFPAAFDDALAGFEWVAANAGLLNVDPNRMSVGGDSAGGNLAAAVALAVRDRGAIKLRAQILTYPIVDLTAPYDNRFAAGVALTNAGMRNYIDAYVPDAAQRKDWRASPLFAPSLKGLAPALVILAGFDPLYAEGAAYAARLEKEKVPVTVRNYPGQMHGFLSRARLLPRAYDAIADIAMVLKANH